MTDLVPGQSAPAGPSWQLRALLWLGLCGLGSAQTNGLAGIWELVVEQVAAGTHDGKAGYATYRVGVDFSAQHVEDVYALYGSTGDPLIVPAAFQVPTPFGSNVGPTNAAFFPINPDAEWDSFLTIGIDGPALNPNAISSVGIEFAEWTESQGITSTDAAVFFMDPDHGATTMPCVFMQLTVPAGSSFQGVLSAQGRSVGDGEDWTVEQQGFDEHGSIIAALMPPPPPGGGEAMALPPPPPPAPNVDHCWIPPDYVSTPCQNGGQCENEGNSYTCVCANGFSGRNCDQTSAPAPAPAPGAGAGGSCPAGTYNWRDGNPPCRCASL